MIKIAIPNKGVLQPPSIRLLKWAGIGIENNSTKRLYSKTNRDNILVLFARTNDIPKYVESGAADIGITGMDLVEENNADVTVLMKLDFGKCRVSVAVPVDLPISSIRELRGKRLATKLPNISKAYLKKKGIDAKIVKLGGATELAPLLGIADGIIDIVSTGGTLRANNLREIAIIMKSSACLIANKSSVEERKEEMEEIRLAVTGAVSSEGKRYMMLNAPSKKALKRITAVLPSMESPTVLKLAKRDEYAIHSVVDEGKIMQLIRRLKEAGGKDILILRMEKVTE